ncbi:hypothetical protein WN51_11759 [Melipona quadrifasciata]|uniref:Uncharacterized protein n=1 Tax=Melipona quadrifasciata TaxID=166423 RepID=A0A0M9A5U6_9HYME|nr:hypothetical protein WN51_11759 [Melipona quadrifasciata]
MSEKVVLTTRKARRLYNSRAGYAIELGRPSFVLTVHRTVWSALSNSNTARIASASVVNSRIPKNSHAAERPEKQPIRNAADRDRGFLEDQANKQNENEEQEEQMLSQYPFREAFDPLPSDLHKGFLCCRSLSENVAKINLACELGYTNVKSA